VSSTAVDRSGEEPSGALDDTVELARRIRLHALRMTSLAGSSHVGSVFSMADIIAVLYGRVLTIDPANPRWEERDRFLLSKGHAGAGVYAALAERGFFAPAVLDTHCADGSDLCGHVSHRNVPGVELSTGSLGHGLSVACGMAYGAKLDGRTHRIIALLSDGECDEGSIWEAVLFAAHHRLDKLTAVIDYNKIQSLAPVADTLALEPFADKWRAFGWHVSEVDGHDHSQLETVLTRHPISPDSPHCVLAHTVKGKGVSFMEHSVLWHYRSPRGEEYDRAFDELSES
jgi:transketolase